MPGANWPALDMHTVVSNGDGRQPLIHGTHPPRRDPRAGRFRLRVRHTRRAHIRDDAAGTAGDLRHHGRDADLQRCILGSCRGSGRPGRTPQRNQHLCHLARGHHERGAAGELGRDRRGRVGVRQHALPLGDGQCHAKRNPIGQPDAHGPSVRHPDAGPDPHDRPDANGDSHPDPDRDAYSDANDLTQAEDPAALRSGQAVLEQRRAPGRGGQLQDLGVEHGGGQPGRECHRGRGKRSRRRGANPPCARSQRTRSAR